MAIIPAYDEDKLRIYQCGVCHGLYMAQTAVNGFLISCAVTHPPGSCCHYQETLITNGQYDALIETMADWPLGPVSKS